MNTSLAYELNRLAGTTGLEEQGAANAWAGTTGLALQGALNTKAGTWGIALDGVCNILGGTTGLAAPAALSYATNAQSNLWSALALRTWGSLHTWSSP